MLLAQPAKLKTNITRFQKLLILRARKSNTHSSAMVAIVGVSRGSRLWREAQS